MPEQNLIIYWHTVLTCNIKQHACLYKLAKCFFETLGVFSDLC